MEVIDQSENGIYSFLSLIIANTRGPILSPTREMRRKSIKLKSTLQEMLGKRVPLYCQQHHGHSRIPHSTHPIREFSSSFFFAMFAEKKNVTVNFVSRKPPNRAHVCTSKPSTPLPFRDAAARGHLTSELFYIYTLNDDEQATFKNERLKLLLLDSVLHFMPPFSKDAHE